MICFHIYNGLGNQMFVYAFARQMKKNGRNYCLSKLGKLKYFKLSGYDYFINSIIFILYKIRYKLFEEENKLILKDQTMVYNVFKLAAYKNVTFDGYFQSFAYLEGLEHEIRSLFKIKAKYKKKFQLFYENEMKEFFCVSIHVRRTDYQSSFLNLNIGEKSFILPLSYYRTVLDKLNLPENHKIIFLSDDIEFVKTQFADVKNAVFSLEDEITDLQILMHSNTLVIANSTFSWWGAWLNNHPEKKIYAPEYFLGFQIKKEFPVNIIPEEWNKIPVNFL